LGEMIAVLIFAVIIGLPLAVIMTPLAYVLVQSSRTTFATLRHPQALWQFMRDRRVRVLIVVQMFVYGAAIYAIPQFSRFQQRSPQAEAKNNLYAIFANQVEYREKHGRYAMNLVELGYQSVPNPGRYLYLFQADENTIELIRKLQGERPDNSWKLVRPFIVTDSFTILAVGNIDNDADLDIWMINDVKELVRLADDVQ
jgi:hypothetical protein